MIQSFTLMRLQSDALSTRSQFTDPSGAAICEALERAFHDPKIDGKTRIAAGTYPLVLRALGSSHFDGVYGERFAGFYRGIFEIANVPGFSAVEIHCGNTFIDSRGCPLVGQRAVKLSGDQSFHIPPGESSPAFIALYRKLYAANDSGGAQLDVKDADGH